MKKKLAAMILTGICVTTAYAGKDFDVETCQAGKAYPWTSEEMTDDVGIINSTSKARHVSIQVNANSPSGIVFDFPCDNDQKELLPGNKIVCLLKPYNHGSGKGYIISWGAKTPQGKSRPAVGKLTVEFN